MALFNAEWIEPSNLRRYAGDDRDFSNNTQYRVGNVVTLRWYTLATYSSVWLNREFLDEPGSEPADWNITTYNTAHEHAWKVNTREFDIAESNVFFLWLYSEYETGENNTILSTYFNITKELVSSSSMTLEASTTALPSASVLTSSTSFSTSSPDLPSLSSIAVPTSTSSPSPDNGLSTGAVAGISVAGTILGLSAAFAILWWFRRRRRQDTQASNVGIVHDPFKHDHSSWQSAPGPASPEPPELPTGISNTGSSILQR
ncbi:hypothetical protein BS50DRAFT_619382 [Corynespora cassiicola Philippines]|uniref:Mid2 domain-containing protein n=1 Tax=Corynespora cassiicola Philippines TaxID=1448308 RepID=A0A2T2NT23_CORCC|nr:hypothetical protein BS50DRAFT_619382 [Corynespora cassiicola Philippines]